MKKIVMSVICIFAAMLINLINSETWAGEIENGTLAIGASSDAIFNLSDNGTGSFDQKGLRISTEIGYFVLKNFELGAELRIAYSKYTEAESQSYLLVPFTAYHWSLSEKSDMYAKIAAGYGIADSDLDTEQTLLLGEIGYQYFVAKNIAIGLSIAGEQARVAIEDELWEIDEKDTYNCIVTQFRFRLYF